MLPLALMHLLPPYLRLALAPPLFPTSGECPHPTPTCSQHSQPPPHLRQVLLIPSPPAAHSRTFPPPAASIYNPFPTCSVHTDNCPHLRQALGHVASKVLTGLCKELLGLVAQVCVAEQEGQKRVRLHGVRPRRICGSAWRGSDLLAHTCPHHL